MKKGKMIIISGPSGVGKKTIIDQFIDKPELNLQYSISMTTRKQRPNEVNGKDYYFVSDEDFNKAIDNNEMVEWTEFCHFKYGTKKSEVKRIIESNANVLVEVEVVGALEILRQNQNNPDLISIFIIPPSIEELEKRLVKRGSECANVIAARIKKATTELRYQDKYQFVVLNDDQTRATKEIEQIIRENINV